MHVVGWTDSWAGGGLDGWTGSPKHEWLERGLIE